MSQSFLLWMCRSNYDDSKVELISYYSLNPFCYGCVVLIKIALLVTLVGIIVSILFVMDVSF